MLSTFADLARALARCSFPRFVFRQKSSTATTPADRVINALLENGGSLRLQLGGKEDMRGRNALAKADCLIDKAGKGILESSLSIMQDKAWAARPIHNEASLVAQWFAAAGTVLMAIFQFVDGFTGLDMLSELPSVKIDTGFALGLRYVLGIEFKTASSLPTSDMLFITEELQKHKRPWLKIERPTETTVEYCLCNAEGLKITLNGNNLAHVLVQAFGHLVLAQLGESIVTNGNDSMTLLRPRSSGWTNPVLMIRPQIIRSCHEAAAMHPRHRNVTNDSLVHILIARVWGILHRA